MQLIITVVDYVLLVISDTINWKPILAHSKGLKPTLFYRFSSSRLSSSSVWRHILCHHDVDIIFTPSIPFNILSLCYNVRVHDVHTIYAYLLIYKIPIYIYILYHSYELDIKSWCLYTYSVGWYSKHRKHIHKHKPP